MESKAFTTSLATIVHNLTIISGCLDWMRMTCILFSEFITCFKNGRLYDPYKQMFGINVVSMLCRHRAVIFGYDLLFSVYQIIQNFWHWLSNFTHLSLANGAVWHSSFLMCDTKPYLLYSLQGKYYIFIYETM